MIIRHRASETTSYAQVRDFSRHLRDRGIVVAPAMGCYGVYADPTTKDLVKVVRDLTGNHRNPLPLTVGTVTMATELIDLSENVERYVADWWPSKPLTWVADARTRYRALSRRLGAAAGTIGVQVADASLQAHVSRERNAPLIGTALYYPDGTPVRDGSDAYEILEQSLERLDREVSVAFVQHDRWRTGTYSSVFTLGDDGRELITLREGDLSRREVARMKRAISPSATMDFT